MTFYVYENWRAENKVVIHRADCPRCNYGQGTKKTKPSGKNDAWHGPFATYREAESKANSLGRPPRDCSWCQPN